MPARGRRQSAFAIDSGLRAGLRLVTSATWVVVWAFIQLALGRRRPQDIPASHALFVVTFIVYLAVTVLLTAVAEDWPVAVKAALVDAVVLPAFVVIVLRLRNVSVRWLQTLTALAGVGALFTAAAIPPFMIISGMQASPISALASLAALALFAWNVLVAGHILRHALSISFPAGLLMAVVYVAVSTAAVGILVPEVMS